MDRSVLDSDHRLLGGLLIAAYAASASSALALLFAARRLRSSRPSRGSGERPVGVRRIPRRKASSASPR